MQILLMKVTVCFEDVRVIVPCGDGEILVRELIEKAIVRYKKATGKSSNHWVSVHNVKTISGGGILDPDDQLNDVVDDREQLIADFEEQGRPGLHHNGGDGASASSTGTTSPDIFHTGDLTHLSDVPHRPFPISQQNGKTDVIVTSRDLSVGTTLTVRRGSEPALNTLIDKPLQNGDVMPIGRGRKESHQESDEPRSESESDDNRSLSPVKRDPKEKSPLSRFPRDSKKRVSLSNNPEMYRWFDAHEAQQDRLRQGSTERKGPVGGSGKDHDINKSPPHKHQNSAIVIVLKNDGGPLGIHVIPDIDDDGKELGLTLQGIEKGGRIERDGRLCVNDRIIEINGTNLEGVCFDNAQRIFRDAMKTPEVRLKVIKYREPPALPKQPPPLMPKPKGHAPAKPSPLTLPPPRGDNSPPTSPEKTSTPADTEKSVTLNNNVNDKNLNFFTNNKSPKLPGSPLPPRDKLPIQPGPPLKVTSPTKKTPPAVPQRHPSTTLSAPKDQAINTLTNTRKIGRKIKISLQKGVTGLGFSITSRDNMTGESPIYIKNIQPKGAAVQDGRLKPGDRLLEVNGVDMCGKSQTEAVSLLRSIPEGQVCHLVVSRQEAVDELFRMPRELNDEKAPPVLQPPEKTGDDGSLANLKNKEVIKFEIPLNDTGSAGLGVSVKGKTSTTLEGTKDLGIFIKSVMNGGAASKDGRLLVNDQLLEVNHITLTNMSNVNAMEQLRRAMQTDGPKLGFILLTIARKIGAPSPFPGETSLDNIDNSQLEVLNNGITICSERTHSRSNSGELIGPSRADNSKLRTDSVHVRSHSDIDRTKPSNSAVDRIISGGTRGDVSEDIQGRQHAKDNRDMSGRQLSTIGVNNKRGETVIIEDDMYAMPRKRQPARPHSTLGIPHVSPAHSRSSSTEDQSDHRPRGSASDWSSELHDPEDDLSPTGDFEFQREGFGRQSMSEKRKGHVDPQGSRIYQRVKETRDHSKGGDLSTSDLTRPRNSGSMESLLSAASNRTNNNVHDDPTSHHKRSHDQPGSQSNMKRSSSFEDLASTDSVAPLDDRDVPMWRFARIGRPRACNDSFRAAVDRSYDAPGGEHNVMDTLEEESMETNSLNHTQSNSARSSFSSENNAEDFHSLRKKKSKDKKSVAILKGLIRLGKGRKSNEETRRSRSAERPSETDLRVRNLEKERYLLAQQEKERIQEFVAQRRQQEEQRLEQQRLQQQQQQQRQKLFEQQQLQQQLDHQKQLEQQKHQQELDQQRQQLEHQRKQQQQRQQQQYFNQHQKLMQQNRPMFYDPHNQYGQEGLSSLGEFPSEGDTGSRGDWGMPDRGMPGERGVSEDRGMSGEKKQYGTDRGMSRADKIQNLRLLHQRQHQERRGHYPGEDIEEFYERQIQDEERKRMERELAGRLHPQRHDMDRSHSRMSSQDSTSNFRSYPSASDSSDISEPNSQTHFYTSYPHSRDRPLSRGQGPGQHEAHYRPPSRGSKQYPEDWYPSQPDFTNANRQTAFTRLNPQPNSNYYGESSRAHRDPKYLPMAGRRPVQQVTDPSSAKV